MKSGSTETTFYFTSDLPSYFRHQALYRWLSEIVIVEASNLLFVGEVKGNTRYAEEPVFLFFDDLIQLFRLLASQTGSGHQSMRHI